MQIIKREDAIALRLNQYFTGAPCKHGHVAYRYTSSGACSTCVSFAASKKNGQTRHLRTANPQAEQDVEAFRHEKRKHDDALLAVVAIKVLADVADLKTINDTAVLMGLAHGTPLKEHDLGGIRSFRAGTPLFILRVHQADADTVYKVAAALWSARVRVEELPHVARLREIEKDLTDKPLPDWTEKP